jgi:PAS domain S-box-containing protein
MNNKKGFFARFTARRSRLIIWGVIGLVLMANLGAIIDSFLHPEIEYFDSEHIIVGLSTALILGIVFVINMIYIERLEKALHNISQSEDALRQSALQNAAVLETAIDGFWLINPGTQRLVEVNNAYCRMSGYSREELLQMTIAQLEAVENFEDVNIHQDRVKEQKSDHFESVHRHKDGSTYPVDISVQYLKETGKLFAFLRDITERKQAEAALRTSEEKYRVLFDMFPLGITVADKDGRILEGNRGAERLLGISKEEQERRAIDGAEWQIIRRDGSIMPSEEYASVRAMKENRLIENVEMGIVKGKDLVTWINVTAIPLRENEVVITYHDITARKQMEEALQKSEERYRLLFNSMTEGFALHELIFDESGEPCDYRFLDINRAFQQLTGLKREDIIGRGQREVLPAEDPFWFNTYCKVALTGESVHLEHYSAPLQKYYEVYAYRPAPNQFAVVFTDITARKQAEDELRESRAILQAAMDQSPAGIAIADVPDGKLRFVNDAGLLIRGGNRQFIVDGVGINQYVASWQLLDLDGRPLQTDEVPLARAVMFGETNHREFIIRRDHNDDRIVLANAAPIKDDAGKLTAAIVVFTDITERKHVEDALRESEERFRAIFEQAAVGVALLETKTGRYVRINQKYCDFLGYTPEEILQKGFQNVTYPEDVQANIDHNALLISGQIRTFSLEKRYVRRDGNIVWGKLTASSLWHPGETPDTYYHIAVVENITERKQAEEEIRQLNASLEQRVEQRTQELRDAQEKLVRQEKLAIIGQMSSSISHELRNPLSVISSAVYYLKLVQPDVNEKIKQNLDIIEQEVRISDKIITDLLDFARVKSTNREPVSVSDLIHQTLERFPAPANVEVILDLPADLPCTFVDPRQMTQVLGNLTTNACQAMKDGGKLSIISRQSAVKAEPLITAKSPKGDNGSLVTDHWLLITVRDTGIGIPAENMSKLFDPLFTTKIKGIGLGLPISQKLTEANGGRIEVQSEAGVGSTFTLWLPVQGGPL